LVSNTTVQANLSRVVIFRDDRLLFKEFHMNFFCDTTNR
jgi:hypothetical protein